MKYTIKTTKRFEKDLNKIKNRGYNLKLLEEVIEMLANKKVLPEKYKNHNLKGEYINCKECHITPDWLLIYKYYNDELVLLLSRTGTHSDLF